MHTVNTARASEWRQHWTVLLPCVAGMMLCATHSYSLGVMIGPLEREFGWAHAAPLLSGVTLREGMASPSFLKLASAVIVYSVALSAMTTNSVPILIAQGLDARGAAGIAGVIGIGSIIGRLSGDFLLDRLAANKVAAVSVLIPCISVLLLIAIPGSAQTAILASLILGLSVGTEVDACAYLAARHFGLRSFGALFGAINGLMLFANGLAPMLANLVYDVTRSYNIFLWAVIPACAIAALLFLSMGAYPEQTEEAQG